MCIRYTKYPAIPQPSYIRLQFNIPWSQFPSLYGSCQIQTVVEGSLQETEGTSPSTFMHASTEPENKCFQSHRQLHAVWRVWQTRTLCTCKDVSRLPLRRQQHWSSLSFTTDPIPLPHSMGLKTTEPMIIKRNCSNKKHIKLSVPRCLLPLGSSVLLCCSIPDFTDKLLWISKIASIDLLTYIYLHTTASDLKVFH